MLVYTFIYIYIYIYCAGAVYLYLYGSSAAPTSAPSAGPDDGQDDDDGWASLSSYNSLGIFLTVMGTLLVVGAAAAVFYFCYYTKATSLKEPLIGNYA